MRINLLLSARLFTLTVTFCLFASASKAAPVAGLTPYQRPTDAPVIEWVQHDEAWYRHALTGITPPYPRSLYFLDNQGYWHTTFNRPGMTGRYDIRGWHRASQN